MTHIQFVDLRAQYEELRTEIDAAMREVIEKCSFISGPAVAAFEKELAESVGIKHAVGCNSATSAGWMLMKGMNIGPGDNVVTTPLTAVATAEYMTMLGARPNFADIDPHTFQLCPKAAEAAIDKNTKAIMPVHLYGIPVDMPAFLDLSRRTGLPLIEDCAQAQGAEAMGKRVGSMGLASFYSFFPSKNLGSFGDAGAACTNDDDLALYVRRFRDHGRSTKYEHLIPGSNERMDTLQAAVLRVKLRRLDAWNAHRREIAKIYDAGLAGVGDVQTPKTYPDTVPVWHLYVIRSDRRDALAEHLKKQGIDTGLHYPLSLHEQPSMRYDYKPEDLPEASKACKVILSLPMHAHMPLDQAHRVVEAIKAFF